jgi:hypothetical protein
MRLPASSVARECGSHASVLTRVLGLAARGLVYDRLSIPVRRNLRDCLDTQIQISLKSYNGLSLGGGDHGSYSSTMSALAGGAQAWPGEPKLVGGEKRLACRVHCTVRE